MEITVYNTNKHRLETLEVEFTAENTTTFDAASIDDVVWRITDFDGGLLISPNNYNYPAWIDDISRNDIEFDHKKAEALLDAILE